MVIEDNNTSSKSPPEGSFVFPTADGKIPPTSQEDIDTALRILEKNKDDWATMTIEDRIAILDQIKLDLPQIIDLWMKKTLEAKGLSANPFGKAEEWVLIAALFRMVRVLRRSLLDIKRYAKPKIPGAIKSTPNGQMIVPSFPQSLKDQIVYQGVSGEVWMQPGISKDDIKSNQAKYYHKGSTSGKISAILGAGSLGLLPIGDFLHKLFVEKKVVILKINPVNDYIGPMIEEGFAPLITRGFLKVVYGGSNVGAYLCNHPTVDEIHITGSDKTFEAILFGKGPDAANRKNNQKPLLDIPLTGELGNISPVIIVPGDWSNDDIQLQAARIASWLSYNPGADKRHRAMLDAHPDAQIWGEPAPGHLPWTLVNNIDSKNSEDICFRMESFYSQIGETAINGANTSEFIEHAVEFVNNILWGNLVATIIIHPKSLQNPQVKAAFERSIAELRYGTICINIFPGIAYTFRTSPFGPYPGNEISDIQSGVGTVNNFLMLENSQKSVFRAPFRNPREPTLFTTKNMDFGRALTKFEIDPSWWNLSRLGIALIRS